MVRRIALTFLLVFAAGCSPSRTAPEPQATSPSPSTSLVPSPVASASGWLAYQSPTPDDDDGVFLVRADGSDDHQIVAGLPGRQTHPDFSRDGKRLAFAQLTSEESAGHVFLADADVDLAKGTERSVVENTFEDGQDHFARWSPDGRKLVFWRGRERPGGIQAAVFVVNVDGTGLRQLTPWDMLASDPTGHPTAPRSSSTPGRCSTSIPASSELYTMRPNGTGLRRLTAYGPNGSRATQPRWTPDGKAILYTRTTQQVLPRHIYVINADGTGDTPVLMTKQICTHPILQPTP